MEHRSPFNDPTGRKRGFERIGKLWDAQQSIDPKAENPAASSLGPVALMRPRQRDSEDFLRLRSDILNFLHLAGKG
jgi:hypothetical protein